VLLGLFIILLLAAQFTSAKSVDEVIEKYIRARGGKARLASMKSIYMEGIKEMNAKEMIVKVIKEQDKLSRTEIETGVANGFVLITKEAGWTFFPLRTPALDKISDQDLFTLQTEMDIDGPLVDYLSKGHKATLVGKEIIEGNNCYKIRLTTNAGKEIIFWLDTATFLINQSSSIHAGEEDLIGRTTITTYRNYREVSGIQFAHTVETKTTGTNNYDISGQIIFYKILVNADIDAQMYQPE